MEFKDQYKHPLWQKKRLEALEYYGFECSDCGAAESQLHVHHVRYKKGAKIWDYEVTELAVLCVTCHAEAHKAKEAINDYFLMYGAGFERSISEIIGGYSAYLDSREEHCTSHLNCVGYGAGYLSIFDASQIIKLTKISPVLVNQFIKENS